METCKVSWHNYHLVSFKNNIRQYNWYSFDKKQNIIHMINKNKLFKNMKRPA